MFAFFERHLPQYIQENGWMMSVKLSEPLFARLQFGSGASAHSKGGHFDSLITIVF